ncbi:hypothetical protein O181_123311 [Austropuccinia psidii MF-1]|uniref:Uncharacterized protein n=1 Tax=Austropuccinia psidii MF-1 TaxID=1389203 RepID=A0A9Q3Q357_9BASI|nr:hypothetical protein [Austropuccinia psidii MF-1]
MKSEGKREIKVELAPVNTENIKPKPKEIKLTVISTSRKENGNTCSQVPQTINNYNFKNAEVIRRKSLTKLFSPIKALKSLSKGIFKNCWKASIKPVATVINVTAEARYLNSHSNKLALNSLKEISLKHKITLNKDIKPQENPIIQEESIESTSKPKQNEELNEILEDIMDNQPRNGNYYGQETAKKASRKPNIKNNGDKDKSLLPQEVTSPPILSSNLIKPEASLKKDNDKIQQLQLFPSNKINIDPRRIMQNKDITQQNLQNSKIGIGKSEQDLSKELIQEPKEESDTYLPKVNNLFHIHTSNKDPTFPEYSQHFKNFNPSRELNKEIQLENEVIKKVVTVEKGIEITKNEDPINLKPQDFTNTRNHIENSFMENKPHPNRRYSSNPMKYSTNSKEEDSPTPNYHSNKGKTKSNKITAKKARLKNSLESKSLHSQLFHLGLNYP